MSRLRVATAAAALLAVAALAGQALGTQVVKINSKVSIAEHNLTDAVREIPGREVLFTSVERSVKYKAKSFIDTVVYRGADFVNAKLHDLLLALGLVTSEVALCGALVAALWGAVGYTLGRRHVAAETARISLSAEAARG